MEARLAGKQLIELLAEVAVVGKVRGVGAARVAMFAAALMREGDAAVDAAGVAVRDAVVEFLCGVKVGYCGTGAMLLADWFFRRFSVGCKLLRGAGSMVGVVTYGGTGGDLVPVGESPQWLFGKAQYGGVLSAAVRPDGGGPPGLRLTVTARGEYVATADCKTGKVYALSDLPGGRYLLPGAVNFVVDKEVFAACWAHVHWLPARVESGGCFLRAVSPLERFTAALVLGDAPTVDAMRPYLMRGVEQARLVDGIGADVHVDTCGGLPPGLPVGMTVGSDGKSMGRLKPGPNLPIGRSMSHVERAIGTGMRRLRSVSAAATIPEDTQGEMSSVELPHVAVTRSVRQTARDALSGSLELDAVSSWTTAMGQVPEDTVAARLRAWTEHLSASGVVDESTAKVLSKRGAEVWPPAPRGIILTFFGDYVPSADALTCGWDRKSSGLPGWNFEVGKLRQGKATVLVPPASSAYARYQFFIDGSVELAGRARVLGRGAVVWSLGPLMVNAVAAGGTVWRSWSDAGACGVNSAGLKLGQRTRDLYLVRGIPVAVSELQAVVFPGLSEVVELKALGTVARVELGIETAVLLVCPSSAMSPPCRLSVSAGRLSMVETAGLTVRAVRGSCVWISQTPGVPVVVRQAQAGTVEFVIIAGFRD